MTDNGSVFSKDMPAMRTISMLILMFGVALTSIVWAGLYFDYQIVAFLLSFCILGACVLLILMIAARKRADILQNALYNISETVSLADSLDDLYISVHRIISTLIPAKNFYIAIHDEASGMLHFPYRIDERDGNPGSRLFTNGLPEHVIKTGRPILVNPQTRANLVQKGTIVTIGAPATDWLGVPLRAGGKVFGVMAVFSFDGAVRYIAADQDVLVFVSNQVAMAITRKQAEERSRYLGMHDVLTGLYNRAYFEEELERFQYGRYNPVAVVMCDIDGLKLVNDTFGHSAGDQILISAARLIKQAIRAGDMAARIGGDEFAVVLPQADEAVARALLGRIQKQIQEHNEQEPGIPISVSLGYAVKVDEGISFQDALREADNNMYKEKLLHSQSARSAIVQTVVKMMEERDFGVQRHAERLQYLSVSLGRKLNMDDSKLRDLGLLAKFHDIGKVGIPDRILFKSGPLTAEERQEMHRHCEIGYRIAQFSPDLAALADFILKHQEWWDGGGYPLGIKGEAIPLECRILAIVDAYDAMTNDRPYRRAMSEETAVMELRRCAGTQFDSRLIELFVSEIADNSSLN